MNRTNNRKIRALLALTGISGCSLGLIVGLSKTIDVFEISKASGSAYSLYLQTAKFNSNSTAPSSETNKTVQTTLGNNVTFSYFNLINYSNGWQTIKPGGYFYNPVSSSGTNNKITDITSVRFESSSSCSLSLYFGYSLNNTDIIWSQERTLNNNVTFSIPSGEHPNYLRIENGGASNININNFTINYSCSPQTYPRQTYNVLMIGNSYSDDTIYYASNVANSYGITLNIYDAYVASCTIDMHLSNLQGNSASYIMRASNGVTELSSTDLTTILNRKTWDVITFQQSSADSGVASSYSNLSTLASQVRSIVGSNPKFYWYQTWAYSNEYSGETNNYTVFSQYNNSQTSMFNSINSCYTNQVASLGIFDKFIPAGTAVQNMRTSYMGDTLNRDGKHMSSVQGRYLLALNMFSNIFDVDLKLSPCSYKPAEVNESYKATCYESIKNAYKLPRSITNSTLTTMPEFSNYNLSNYTEIDAEMVGCTYWNSTDGTNYGIRIAGNNQFVSTKRFTQADLPVGSLIFIAEYIGYRPEAWASNAAQSSRPNEAYANVIEVNSAFWSGYQYRAFNLFKIGKPTLGGQHYQIFDGFHIYVPNASLGSIKVKGDNSAHASTDAEYFKSSGLNFSSYQRMQLDPIYGYYNSTAVIDLAQTYNDSTAKKFLCTRVFNTNQGELPENTVVIIDSGYQWRPDAWHDSGLTEGGSRPDNIKSNFTTLDSTFMSSWRRRAINLSPTDGTTQTGQNFISIMDKLRIYTPIPNANIYADVTDIPDVSGTNYPEGTFKGTAHITYGSGFDIDLVIAIGNSTNKKVAVMASNTDVVATGITFTQSTNAISISTTGSVMAQKFGNITGTYDKANNRITNVKCSGAIGGYVQGNGSLIVTRPTNNFFGCEGTTNTLQTKFKHRSGDPWAVDLDSDRLVKDSTNYISGSGAVKMKGNTSKRVAMNLSRDIANPTTVKDIHFWVYNPSSTSVTVRIFVYKGPNLTSAVEVVSGGKAFASGWTYYAVGFTEGVVYNIQLSDFSNSGVNLTFDNIYLL